MGGNYELYVSKEEKRSNYVYPPLPVIVWKINENIISIVYIPKSYINYPSLDEDFFILGFNGSIGSIESQKVFIKSLRRPTKKEKDYLFKDLSAVEKMTEPPEGPIFE